MNSGHDETQGIGRPELLTLLQGSLEKENDLLRTYVIASERIHDNESLKVRLHNFAEGNAKRTRQLMDEIAALQDENAGQDNHSY